jgi:hypothetical protein
MRSRYPVPVQLDGALRYIVWYESEDFDGIELDERGQMLAFADIPALDGYAAAHAWDLCDITSPYQFDYLRTWLEQPTANGIDCPAFLNAWNLFIDLRSAIAGRDTIRDPDGARSVYDKLFRGNNLPSVTPKGERFQPAWDESEIAALARVLGDGLQLFSTRLPP